MPMVDFDPTVSAGERPQTYALECAATGTGTIKQIIYNNKNDTAILNKGSSTNDERKHKERKAQTRWAKFTYVGRQTKFITNLFKHSTLKLYFKTEDTIGNLLAQNKNINPNKFSRCSVCQLACHNFNRKYIG
jgi:hypothetical protein